MEQNVKCAKIIISNVKVYIPMGQLVDLNKEKERIQKEIDNVIFEINRSEKMLSNEGFVAKAPKELVEKEKNKLISNKQMLKRLQQEISSL